MNFSEYYFTLLSESAFSNLPPNAPYGFWVYPNGDFHVVRRDEGHNATALKIVKFNDKLRDKLKLPDNGSWESEYDREMEAYQLLHRNGYARLVKENNLLHWDCIKSPASAQMRTIRDLADFYRLELYK